MDKILFKKINKTSKLDATQRQRLLSSAAASDVARKHQTMNLILPLIVAAIARVNEGDQ